MKIEGRRKKVGPTKVLREFLLYFCFTRVHSVVINVFAKSCILPMSLSEEDSMAFLASSNIHPVSIRTLYRYSQELNQVLDRQYRIQIAENVGSGEIILVSEDDQLLWEDDRPTVINRNDPGYMAVQKDQHLSHLYRLILLYEHFEAEYIRFFDEKYQLLDDLACFGDVDEDEQDIPSIEINSNQAREFLLNQLELLPDELSLRSVQRYLKEIKEMITHCSWICYLLEKD